MPGFRGPHGGSFTPGEKVERPADKAVRRANLRRIGRLFRGYWGKLSVVTVLIVVASLLGVIPAFLLRDIISKAFKPLPHGHVTVDMTLLTALVLGMIAISVVGGVIGVIQSYMPAQLSGAEVDAIIAATPVYKAGISGLFKSFADLVDNDLLIAAPVVLAATGGTARHAMVVDDQLRPLFAFLRAHEGQVFLTTTRRELIDTGDPATPSERRDFAVVSGSVAAS